MGINSYASNLDQNLFYAIGISELLPILDRNNIAYEVSTGAEEDGSIMLYAIAGVAVVVVITVIAPSRIESTWAARLPAWMYTMMMTAPACCGCWESRAAYRSLMRRPSNREMPFCSAQMVFWNLYTMKRCWRTG